MQPRSLEQILGELDSVYNPQINTIRQKQSELPGMVQAEEQGLQAKQSSAFDEILGGARRRGIGFSGIPIGEQAKYNATEYMPALARLKQSGREQALSLEDAINKIYESRLTFGNQLKQNEDQLFESRRQFDTNLAFQKEQEANRLREAARAAAASSAAFAPSFSPGGGGPTTSPVAQKTQPLTGGKTLQDAASALNNLLRTNNRNVINNTIQAIQSSASRGNTYDQAKLQLISRNPAFAQFLANSNGAKF